MLADPNFRRALKQLWAKFIIGSIRVVRALLKFVWFRYSQLSSSNPRLISHNGGIHLHVTALFKWDGTDYSSIVI